MLAAAVAMTGCSGSAQSRKEPVVEPVADITIVGCVEPADSTTAAGRTVDTKYMLTNSKSGTNNSSRETAGTSGSTSNTPAASTYQLDATDATITPEIGHEVEIVAVAPAAEPGAKAPKLKVQKIKMVAMKCTK
jgi:hypothetical protein